MMRSDSPRSTSHSRSVPSPLPLSRLRLSGVKARPYTTALCPSSAARALPSWPSHSQIVWSKLPLASVPPSGLQATQCTLSVCPTSVWRPRRLPVSPTSQSLTVPSQLALASRLPLGAKASPRTQLLYPQRRCTQRAGPVLRISHSRIVPAKSPLASRRPSGLQASERTGPGCGTSSRAVPSFTSQSRTVASYPPLASRLPPGAKARQMVALVCQPDQSAARLSTSHSLRAPSQLPVASVRSSGLKARDVTMSVWACQTRCKIWPSSRHTRTSPRWLAAAQYCPLRLMVTPQMASKVSLKTHSRSSAPDRFASCSSTPCRETPCRMRSESLPCWISWLAVVTSLLVTYSSTTDCKVKLPARCPRSMSERRRRPSTASKTWTCESLAISTASRSSRVTGSRRVASQHSTVCSRGESRAHCSSSSWVMLPKTTVPPERNGSIWPPKRSEMVSATIPRASGLPS